MKQFGRQLHSQAKSVKLRSVERAELKERLQMYMEYHPMPTTQTDAHHNPAKVQAATPEPALLTAVQRWFAPFAGVTAAFLIFILPVIAEQAVPGDLLYPMKVQINEELRSTLTFSSQEKIEWETTRIERRLAEARLLESQGKLTTELEEAVASAVRTHAQNTEAEIAALREVDADEAAAAEVSFASSLAVQSEVLSQTIDERATSAPASPVLLAVQSEEEEANARSADSSPSYERMLALIETETTTATELFHSIKGSIPEEEVARLESRFAAVQAKIDTVVATHEEVSTAASATLMTTATATATSAPEAADLATAEAAITSTSSEDTNLAEEGSTTTAVMEAADTAETAPQAPDQEPASTTETDIDKDTAAVNELREVLRDVKRIIRFMSDITVREAVSIEEWIPEIVSAEQQVTDLEALLAEMERIQALVAEETLSASTTAEVEAAQQALVRNIFTIEELLRINDLETAEAEVATAYADAQALLAMVEEQMGTTTEIDSTATTSTASTTAQDAVRTASSTENTTD